MDSTAVLITVPHAPDLCYGSRLHCWHHGTDEPDSGCFRACLECGHVYATPEALLGAWLKEYPSSVSPQWREDPSQIWGCAFCGHDF